MKKSVSFARTELDRLVAYLKQNPRQMLLLKGPVGSGKTTLVQAFVGFSMPSPSFVGYQWYEQEKLLHVDEYFKPSNVPLICDAIDRDFVVFIEWPRGDWEGYDAWTIVLTEVGYEVV